MSRRVFDRLGVRVDYILSRICQRSSAISLTRTDIVYPCICSIMLAHSAFRGFPFQVAEAVAAEMSKPNADPAIAAAALVDLSLRAGSRDNMSAMIVQFQNASAPEAAKASEPYGQVEEEFIAGPFYQVRLFHLVCVQFFGCSHFPFFLSRPVPFSGATIPSFVDAMSATRPSTAIPVVVCGTSPTRYARATALVLSPRSCDLSSICSIIFVRHFDSQASVAELDRTIEQLQIRVDQNGDSQEDFERTCERMRNDLQTSYEVDLRRAT